MAERTGRHARAADWPRAAAARHSLAHRPVLEPGVPAGRGQGAGFLCAAQARRVGGGERAERDEREPHFMEGA